MFPGLVLDKINQYLDDYYRRNLLNCIRQTNWNIHLPVTEAFKFVWFEVLKGSLDDTINHLKETLITRRPIFLDLSNGEYDRETGPARRVIVIFNQERELRTYQELLEFLELQYNTEIPLRNLYQNNYPLTERAKLKDYMYDHVYFENGREVDYGGVKIIEIIYSSAYSVFIRFDKPISSPKP